MSKIEKYIADNELEDKKIADVLRDYDKGYKTLGDICWFHGYNIDKAISHIKKING